MSSETGKLTLYERLGGVYSIAAVVDDFIDRVMHNPVLNANAAVDEAHHRVSAAGFKYYVTEMVCWLSRFRGTFHSFGSSWLCYFRYFWSAERTPTFYGGGRLAPSRISS